MEDIKLKCATCLPWDGLGGAHSCRISGLEGSLHTVGDRGTYCPASFWCLLLTTGMNSQWPICPGWNKKYSYAGNLEWEQLSLNQVAKTREVKISIQQKHQHTRSSAGKTLCPVCRKSIFGSPCNNFHSSLSTGSGNGLGKPPLISEGPVGQRSWHRLCQNNWLQAGRSCVYKLSWLPPRKGTNRAAGKGLVLGSERPAFKSRFCYLLAV